MVQIHLDAYNPETDAEELKALYEAHEKGTGITEALSTSGYLARSNKDGKIVGAAFLYTTNSPMAIVDSFVVDKDLNRLGRNFVIENLLAAVTALAYEWDYKFLLAEPRFSKSEKRLQELGFTEFRPGSYILRF